MAKTWTSDRVEELRSLVAKGATAAEAANALGVTCDAAGNAIRRYNLKGRWGTGPATAPTTPPEPPDPVAQHQAQRTARCERTERKELLDRLAEAERRCEFWADLHSSPMPPAIPQREFTSGLREGVAVALLSDAHIQEYVDAAKVADRNAYNLEISQRRMQRFFAGVRWLVEFQRQAWKVRDLVLWLGGDLMTGYIHDELIESNELSPTETVIELRRRLESGIDFLLEDDELAQITIPCSYGNHGRLGQKRRIKTGAESSYEWMLYNLMAEDYADEPRVRFEIPRGAHTYVQVYDAIHHFHHGDELTYWGGVGGLTIPLGKRVPKWDKVKRADMHHIC